MGWIWCPVALVVLLAAVWVGQRILIYHPDRAPLPPAASVLAGASDVELVTSDGLRLSAWLVRPSSADRRFAVLVAPGNAGNRRDRAGLAAALAAEGLTVLLMDYRGYGGNPGRPSQTGLARDVRAGLAHLVEQAGFEPARIVYFGESLGAAVVTELAHAQPAAGLLLRSPFTDLASVGRHHYPVVPVRLLLRDRFPVADLISEVTTPTIVVYGTVDTIVPARLSQEVAARAANLIEAVPVAGADHNDEVLFGGPQVVGAVVRLAGIAGPPNRAN